MKIIHEEMCPICRACLEVGFDDQGPTEPYEANHHFTAFPEAIQACPWCKGKITLIRLAGPDVDGNPIFRLCDTQWDIIEERHYEKMGKWGEQVEDCKSILDDKAASETKRESAKKKLGVLEERIGRHEAAFSERSDKYFEKKQRLTERIDKKIERAGQTQKAAHSGGGCVLPAILFLLLFGAAMAATSPSDSTGSDTPEMIPSTKAAATQDSASAGDSLNVVPPVTLDATAPDTAASAAPQESDPAGSKAQDHSKAPSGDSWWVRTLLALVPALIGWAAGWHMANKRAADAPKIRQAETIAERTVDLYPVAYSHMKKVASLLERGQTASAQAYMEDLDKEGWWAKNRMLLPDRFVECWLSVRNALPPFNVPNIRVVHEAGSTLFHEDPSGTAEDLAALKTCAAEALTVLGNEWGKSPLVPDDLRKKGLG